MDVYGRLRETLGRYTLLTPANSLPAAVSTMSCLDLVSLLVLVDLELVPQRTAMRGNATYLDALTLVPGMHRQLAAPDLSKAEYPACAAMTTGYVFRVENAATVYYLQSVGRPGQLTTLSVKNLTETKTNMSVGTRGVYGFRGFSWKSVLPYLLTVCLTGTFFQAAFVARDWWAFGVGAMLVAARAIFAFIIRCRAQPGWFGAPEPGVESDLLVLLSQDRWIRIKGPTDDVKAVTSGTWFREPTFLERSLAGFAQYLIFLAVALFYNATADSKLLFFIVLSLNAFLAHIANESEESLLMHGRRVEISQPRVKYVRRIELAEQLVKEFKRTDCFVGMGMIQPHQAEGMLKKATAKAPPAATEKSSKASYDGPVVM